MFATLFACGSAACYGAADFLGGKAVRRVGLPATILVSTATAFLLLGLMAMTLESPAGLSARDLLLSLLAGSASAGALLALYSALARGPMAIAAPVSAVTAVAVPVLFDATFGGALLAPLAWVGIALAGAAVIALGQGAPELPATRVPLGPSLALAFLGGLGIAILYIALKYVSPDHRLWPSAIARGAGLILLLAVVAPRWRAGSLRLSAGLGIAVAAGALDAAANLAYVLAVQNGTLSVIVTLVSLYPLATVLLAIAIDRERLSVWQAVGIPCALAAAILLSLP